MRDRINVLSALHYGDVMSNSICSDRIVTDCTNKNSVDMEAMAQITSRAASIASSTGVSIQQLSALGGVAEATTKIGGDRIGNALKTLLLNLQDTTNSKIVDTYDALGISMTKIVNGASELKTPIELLTALKDKYNALGEGDPLRTQVLNKIGGRHLPRCLVTSN